MNKKLMAMAVAGALAAPMAALAQTSTVQVYGLVNMEYGFVNQADMPSGVGRSNVDALNAGASRLGFRGEEQLGGGLSAWFQCESDFRFLGGTTETSGTWCDRNSALGMKGGWGNAYIGTWDSPAKKTGGLYRVGVNDTGWTGVTTMTQSNGGIWTGTVSDRNPHSVNYDTPNFGGFSATFQYTTLQVARNAGGTMSGGGVTNNQAPTAKGRRIGASVQYVGGPLAVYGNYSQADDDKSGGTNAAGANGGKDTYWSIGGSFAFGPAKVAAAYFDGEIDIGAGAWPGTVIGSRERKSWHVSGEWNIAGPHTLRGGYSHAGDTKGVGISSALLNADNGADLWQIGYQYTFSKRTYGTIIYARQNNDSQGTYALTGNSGAIRAGDDSGVLALQMVHTF
jgi:predicted porin